CAASYLSCAARPSAIHSVPTRRSSDLIANILERPNKLYDTSVTVPAKEYDPETGESQTVGRKDAHVWHCSLSLRAEEGQLDDATDRKSTRLNSSHVTNTYTVFCFNIIK